jgi:hypothetical protein
MLENIGRLGWGVSVFCDRGLLMQHGTDAGRRERPFGVYDPMTDNVYATWPRSSKNRIEMTRSARVAVKAWVSHTSLVAELTVKDFTAFKK